MEGEALAYNLKKFRAKSGLSQPDLAKLAGISLPALKNLESSRTEPREGTLMALSRALNVSFKDLLTPVRPLNSVRFRSNKRMQTRENILSDVSLWLDDFNFLENLLEDRIPFKLEEIQRRCSRDDVVQAAEDCRKVLDISITDTVVDLCRILEEAGVKVYTSKSASEGFFGLSVAKQDGGPAVVVNVWERIPVERRIFSAAHELGHLLLHGNAYDVKQTEEVKKEEEEADKFAGHFLMPNAGFHEEWNKALGLTFIDRVFKIKTHFQVSYKTVLYRLIELNFVDNSIWPKFNFAYQHRFGMKLPYKVEPFGLDDFGFVEDRYSRLCRRALEQKRITRNRGAEILRINLIELMEKLKAWEIP